jgi:peptide/nickel transport system substrate-binding protein
MLKVKKVLALLLVLTLAFSLVGCGNDQASDSSAEADSNEAVKEVESIVRITQDWPTYIDPGVGSDFSDTIALVNLYDSLVFPEPDGTVSPSLATEWTSSEDGTTFTFMLRDDVTFHNGNAFTASDVVFTAERMLTIGEGYAYLYKSLIEEVTAVDEYTVEFKLNQPFGPFVKSMIRMYILDEETVMANLDKSDSSYGEFGDYGKKWLQTNDAGSGPYMVREVKMEEFVLAEQYPEYWGGWDENAPKLFQENGAVEPISVRTAMSNRELEITDEIQPEENYQTMDKIEGVDIAINPTTTNNNMCLNTKVAPTDDVNFRKALAYILDYDTISSVIFPGATKGVGPVPMQLPGAYASETQYYRDVEKAKEYLAMSEYADQLDDYPVKMTWCAEVPAQEKLALLFQANCAELGITVEITKKPFGAMIADAATAETTANATLLNVGASYFDAGAMLKTRYHTDTFGSWEQMEWYGNPEMDAMIEEALATIDDAARFEMYKEILEIIVDDCPTLWTYDHAEKRAYQSAYLKWDLPEKLDAGLPTLYPMGYSLYVHDMEIIQ